MRHGGERERDGEINNVSHEPLERNQYSRWGGFKLEISYMWGSTMISIGTFINLNININDLDDNITNNVLKFADDIQLFRKVKMMVMNNVYKTI